MLTLGDGTSTLSRNVVKDYPLALNTVPEDRTHGSLQGGEFLDQLRNSRLLNLDSPIVNYVGSYLFSCLVSIVGWLVTVRQQAISDINQDTRPLADIRLQNLGPPH